MVISEEEKKNTAYHEIGHALVAASQTHSAPVEKITIIPHTNGSLGYTMQVDEQEKLNYTKEDLFTKIVTFTGGRAAEEVVFNHMTAGASNDIEQATRLARAMVTRFGMTEEFGMMGMETIHNAYLGGDATLTCSETTLAKVDVIRKRTRRLWLFCGSTGRNWTGWRRTCWKRKPSPVWNSWRC